MEKFKSFITEETKPYRMLVLVHSTPDDPNKTGVKLAQTAKTMGIDLYQFEVTHGYVTTNAKKNMVVHNYVYEKDVLGDKVKENNDEEGWEVNPENTICIIRGSDRKVYRFAEQLRLHGVKTINSLFTNTLCDDKWLNYIAMEQSELKQPRTALLTHENNIDTPIKQIGGKYPMILKTAQGTQGVGVIFIDSRKTLLATMQLINKIDSDIAMLIQEFIPTPYDVRVIILNNEIVAQLKRPVITGDFRSNISQGNEPEKIELTDLEKSECLKAAKSVNGMWLGIDFIPSKDREKEPPYFIEINSSPGTGYVNELNDINIYKMVLETFKNRDNWS